MRIYISVDMEGISGINNPEHVSTTGRLYGEGRRLVTADANAAVRGAFDGGADEVIVADMHGASCNILPEELDPRALLLAGTPHTPRFPFLDGSVDGMFLVGYHAMAGTAFGTLEHTMMSKVWADFAVNGKSYGEVGIDAEIAAYSGVPVVMASGDDVLAREVAGWFSGKVEFAAVKQGVGRARALCLSPAKGQERVYDAARRAVGRLAAGERFPLTARHSPATVRITYKMTPDADAAMTYGAKRVSGYAVEREYPRFCDAFGGIWSDEGNPVRDPVIFRQGE